jgi:hypothetical protein
MTQVNQIGSQPKSPSQKTLQGGVFPVNVRDSIDPANKGKQKPPRPITAAKLSTAKKNQVITQQ